MFSEFIKMFFFETKIKLTKDKVRHPKIGWGWGWGWGWGFVV